MARAVALDASVVVRWFKKGEPDERLALKLRDDALCGEVSVILTEWVPLEVVRALVKVGLPAEKVQIAYGTLKDMINLGFVELVPVSELLDQAKELEVELNLCASDAVNLASALLKSVDMVSEDRHLHREHVRRYIRGRGLRVLRLAEYYAA